MLKNAELVRSECQRITKNGGRHWQHLNWSKASRKKNPFKNPERMMAGKWPRIDKKSIGPSHADLGRRSAANFFFLQ